MAAPNVIACGCRRISASSCSGSYGADCMFAASTEPHSMYGFQSGHSPRDSDARTAACQGIICM